MTGREAGETGSTLKACRWDLVKKCGSRLEENRMALKKSRVGVLVFIILSVAALVYGVSRLNRYQVDGELFIKGLNAPVKVVRDEKGMAYIYAEDLDDALVAQGFVTAQDRLFQMELNKLYARGRISELAGEQAVELDARMRTLGFYRNAREHAAILDEDTKRLFSKYVDGVNAYIETRGETHPLEFKLAGIKPEPWEVPDSLAVFYYLSWNTSANMKSEMITQMLIDKVGASKASEIFPINVNPDDLGGADANPAKPNQSVAGAALAEDRMLLSYMDVDKSFGIGSNNWVVSGDMTKSGKPVLANDPHLDARLLPGPWHPVCLITPEHRIVGAGLPGTPGIVVGRNENVAWGVTNAYGDAQDLYIETVDPGNPDNYLEGEKSIPFQTITEKLKIKDKNAPDGRAEKSIVIRLTKRGPVVSGVLKGFKTDNVVTLRWAPFVTKKPAIEYRELITAKNAQEARKAISSLNLLMLNYVFADKDGNIGWFASGRLPIRSGGDGSKPRVVSDDKDDWVGWIPADEAPQALNPDKKWVGTCNHYTVGSDYPYYYSSYAASSYRYSRLKQLMSRKGETSADDHWNYQLDAKNLMAEQIAPIMVGALGSKEDVAFMADALSGWDYVDDPEKTAPAVFQAVYRNFALRVFRDELGEDLTQTMLSTWYYWQERLQAMVLEGDSPWFDDIGTSDKKETMADIFYLAAKDAVKELQAKLGEDASDWKWGKLHRLDLVSPIRRSGAGKDLLGSGPRPYAGSGETLHRGIYDFNKPYDVWISASLRMVVDLADDDKVMAVIPGGTAARILHPHAKDQVDPFLSGEKVYWYYSDKEIQLHKRNELIIKPQ